MVPMMSVVQQVADNQCRTFQSISQIESAFNKATSRNIDHYFSLADCRLKTGSFFETPIVGDLFQATPSFTFSDLPFELNDLSQKLFSHSKPLESDVLEVLEFTFNRLRSKSPTRLD